MWEKNCQCDIRTAQWDDGTVKCEKKIKEPPNVIKKTVTCNKNRTNAMLILLNITMEPSNLRKKKKNKGTTICDKRTVKCYIGTTQCDNRTVECEKKNKETTKCEKRIVKYDIRTAQCEDETVKCEKKK